MVLPQELLPFAENFYRRFPEEFVALGMPGLEQVFDLRVDGSRTRKISETATEKTVEIIIRRWQAPSLMFPAMSHASYGPHMACLQAARPGSEAAWGQYVHQGSPPGYSQPLHQPGYSQPQHQPQPQQTPAPSVNPVEAQMASQLTRLEAALSTLKPQLEVAMASQQQAQAQLQRHQAPPAKGSSLSQSSNSRSPGTYATFDSNAPQSPLRTRRGVHQIQISPTTKEPNPDAVVKSPVKQAPASVPASVEDKQPRKDSKETASSTGEVAKDKSRPKITAVRMMPSAMDPESPRSPGKFSAWK